MLKNWKRKLLVRLSFVQIVALLRIICDHAQIAPAPRLFSYPKMGTK